MRSPSPSPSDHRNPRPKPKPNPNTLTLTLTSMTFQVVADEIREGQAAYQKKWEKETRGMREHLSINQKRLFLLEQEKNQLQQTASASESLTGVLRDQVRVRGRVWVRVRVLQGDRRASLGGGPCSLRTGQR